MESTHHLSGRAPLQNCSSVDLKAYCRFSKAGALGKVPYLMFCPDILRPTRQTMGWDRNRKEVGIGANRSRRLYLLGENQACGDISIRHSRGKGGEGWVGFQSKRRKAHRSSGKPWNCEPTEAAHDVTWKCMNRARCNGFVIVAF